VPSPSPEAAGAGRGYFRKYSSWSARIVRGLSPVSMTISGRSQPARNISKTLRCDRVVEAPMTRKATQARELEHVDAREQVPALRVAHAPQLAPLLHPLNAGWCDP
jgi:hypothetical protein